MLIVFQDLTVPAAFCFATGMYATGSIPVLLEGTTWRRDLHQAAVHVGRDVVWGAVSARHHVAPQVAAVRVAAARARRFPRDAALTVAALLILTIPTGDPR